jgi:CO/xanthine dehydrogenase Mo-binding subunit
MDDYKLHLINKMPQSIKPIFIESIDVIGPYGAKGIGEPANMPAQPCIANAIYDAIGVRMTQVPMNPYRIVKAVKSL